MLRSRLANRPANLFPDFDQYLIRRLSALLKGPILKKGLPQLLRDARTNIDALVESGSTDPFDSIYKMVFHFTMRTMACNEIADDPKTLAKCLGYFEAIEGAVSTVSVMYPWVPTLGKAVTMYKVCCGITKGLRNASSERVVLTRGSGWKTLYAYSGHRRGQEKVRSKGRRCVTISDRSR